MSTFNPRKCSGAVSEHEQWSYTGNGRGMEDWLRDRAPWLSFARMFAMVCVLVLAGCGGGGSSGGNTSGDQTASVTLSGAGQKGPFLSGAVLTVYPIETDGSLGAGQQVATLDANGGFSSAQVPWSGPSELRVSGQSFNENDGSSLATLTLNGVADLQAGGSLDINVNLFTHLLAARVRQLMAEGTDYGSAYDAALGELDTQVGLTVGVAPETLDITVGGSVDNANLLLFSAALLQVTQTQADIDNLAEDFADDGRIDNSAVALYDSIGRAAASVDLGTVADNLQAGYGVDNPPSSDDLGGTPPVWTNAAPVAVAGADQTVTEGSTVALDGRESSDSDGTIAGYAWSQTAGATVSLNATATAQTSFTAPVVTSSTTLGFLLTVTDNDGASSTDAVTVTVEPVNAAPAANAGSDQSVQEGAVVTLDGSGSSDSDGTIAGFAWSQSGGAPVTLNDSATARPSFTAPSVSGQTQLTFVLTVTDNEGATADDTVIVTVGGTNRVPSASAGSDLTVNEGAVVTLDGSGSNDSDGSIGSYAWSQTAGTAVSLSSATASQPTFTAPTVTQATQLGFLLTVTDNAGATANDSVVVTVMPVNVLPVAAAGTDQSVDEGSTVRLDASGSSDSDGSIGSYVWSQTAGNAVILSNATVAQPTFIAPTVTQMAQLSFQLTVTDNEGGSASDSVSVTVNPVNATPQADAGGPYNGSIGAGIALSAAASSDGDGSIVGYAWDLDNDGQYDDASGVSATFSATGAGTYTVGLQVVDNEGATDSVSTTVVVSDSAAASAYAGYNLYQTLNSTTAYLMDNDGNVVHSWATSYRPGNAMYLLENGDLLRTGNVGNSTFTAGGAGGIVQRIDWDGNVTWEYEYASATHLQHHDVEMLPNGNVLMVAWQYKSEADAIAAGRDPGSLGEGELWVDSIIEVQPSGSNGGTIVWQWNVWDHLVQDYDAGKANYGVVADHPELVDLNYTLNNTADWNHINSVDYNADLDQIIVSVHNFSEIWIIDHSTTSTGAAGHSGGSQGKGGDLLYRWGNPQTYGAGTGDDQKLFLQHDAEWIASGLPGEGHILVFNNGMGRPAGNYSSVEEIVPPVDGNGAYTLTQGEAYGPQQSVWTYSAANPSDFYGQNISSAQRLPNGNTLICEGPDGYFFEVTSSGEIVWEYNAGGSVFRVNRYGLDYSGFSGTDLDNNVGGQAPNADAGGPYAATMGSVVALDGSASSDGDGLLVSFAWDLDDDGQFDDATGFSASFSAATAGTFTVSLQVTDDQGLTDTDTTTVTVTAPSASVLSYPMVDTAQVSCYDAAGSQQTCTGNGYDADYTGNAPSYTLSNDGTEVSDEVTGLVWTQTPDLDGNGVVNADDKLTQPDAVGYCASLSLGGNSWRLPSIKELYSLMEFSGTDPSGYTGTDTAALTPFIDAIFQPGFGDTDAGERIIDGQYATTTIYTSPAGTLFGAGTMFGVNFIDGRIKGYPYDFPTANPKTFYVLCVTGNSDYGVNDFHDNGNGTVSDNATGLMWEQDDTANLNFEEAVAHCEAANTGGFTDWRLPNVKELQGIVDYSRAPDSTSSAAIDPVFNATSFTNEGGATDWGYYWSSTTHVKYNGLGNAGSYVSFGRALGYFNSAVVDVHGAGAQRSNDKTDVSSDRMISSANVGYGLFYYGGPQGDIARNDNMVRCVRDSDGVANR